MTKRQKCLQHRDKRQDDVFSDVIFDKIPHIPKSSIMSIWKNNTWGFRAETEDKQPDLDNSQTDVELSETDDASDAAVTDTVKK